MGASSAHSSAKFDGKLVNQDLARHRAGAVGFKPRNLLVNLSALGGGYCASRDCPGKTGGYADCGGGSGRQR